MLYIHIDEAIKHHNENVGVLDKVTRLGLGKTIMPDYSDGTINKTLSNWQNGKMIPTPTPEILCKIAEVLSVSVDQLLGRVEIINERHSQR